MFFASHDIMCQWYRLDSFNWCC